MGQAIAASFFLVAVPHGAMSLLLPMPHSTDNVVPHIEYRHPYGFSTPPGTAIMCFSDLILFRAGRIGKPDLEQTFYNQEINR